MTKAIKSVIKVGFIVFCFGGAAAVSKDNNLVKTDLKFLCEIDKMEKSLSMDKDLEASELAERIYSIKQASLRDQKSKEALKAISKQSIADQLKTWKKFALDNNVELKNCF